MVPMVQIAVAAGVVVVVAGLLTWLVRRRSSDEVHSVDGYRQTLNTLQGIRSRSGSGTVRVLGGPPAPGEAPVASGVPTTGTHGPDAPEGEPAKRSGRDLVLENDPNAAGPNTSSPRSQRSQDRAISAMNRRPRRLAGPVVVVVVVLALLAAVLVIGARSHHPKGQTSSPRTHDSSTTATSSTRSGAGSTTTTSGSKSRSGSKGATTTTGPKASTSTTTTAPHTYTAATSTPTTATYTPPSGSYTVTLSATSGSCWLTVTSSNGTVLLSQTLTAGEVKQVTNSGSATIVVGAPSVVKVTIDHRPVVLPPGYQTPFTISLTPAP